MSQINKNRNESSRNKISSFNSKLFFDIELSNENILLNINTEDSESMKTSTIQLKDYLSNDLIEQLELPLCNSDSIKEQKEEDNQNTSSEYFKVIDNKNISNDNNISNINIIKYYNIDLNNNAKEYTSINYNPLIPLINKGYEFTPRNLQNSSKNSNYSNNHVNNIYNFNKNKKYIRKNKKDDWYCSLCNNLNYSFRVKCNRCGSSRIISDYYIYQKLSGEQKNNIFNSNNNENENKK